MKNAFVSKVWCKNLYSFNHYLTCNTIHTLLLTYALVPLEVTRSMYLLMADQASPISSFPLLTRRDTMLGTTLQPLQHLLFPRAVVGHGLQIQDMARVKVDWGWLRMPWIERSSLARSWSWGEGSSSTMFSTSASYCSSLTASSIGNSLASPWPIHVCLISSAFTFSSKTHRVLTTVLQNWSTFLGVGNLIVFLIND